MHLSEIWHSKKNDSRLSRTQFFKYALNKIRQQVVLYLSEKKLDVFGPNHGPSFICCPANILLRVTPAAKRNTYSVAMLAGGVFATQGSVLRPQPWAAESQLLQSCRRVRTVPRWIAVCIAIVGMSSTMDLLHVVVGCVPSTMDFSTRLSLATPTNLPPLVR